MYLLDSVHSPESAHQFSHCLFDSFGIVLVVIVQDSHREGEYQCLDEGYISLDIVFLEDFGQYLQTSGQSEEEYLMVSPVRFQKKTPRT